MVDPTELPGWGMDSGGNGANPASLTAAEFDGYVWLDDTATADDDASPLHVPWQVLPRAAGDVALSDEIVSRAAPWKPRTAPSTTPPSSSIRSSRPARTTRTAARATPLPMSTSGRHRRPDVPQPGGLLLGGRVVRAGAGREHLHRQTHAVAPAFFEGFDTDGDGTVDYAVYNADISRLRCPLGWYGNVVNVPDVDAGTQTAFFTTDYRTNSANTVLYLCGEQIGMNATDFWGAGIAATVFAVDFYQSGTERDVIADVEFAPLGDAIGPATAPRPAPVPARGHHGPGLRSGRDQSWRARPAAPGHRRAGGQRDDPAACRGLTPGSPLRAASERGSFGALVPRPGRAERRPVSARRR